MAGYIFRSGGSSGRSRLLPRQGVLWKAQLTKAANREARRKTLEENGLSVEEIKFLTSDRNSHDDRYALLCVRDFGHLYKELYPKSDLAKRERAAERAAERAIECERLIERGCAQRAERAERVTERTAELAAERAKSDLPLAHFHYFRTCSLSQQLAEQAHDGQW